MIVGGYELGDQISMRGIRKSFLALAIRIDWWGLVG